MVERSLSMREVTGSMPVFSIYFGILCLHFTFKNYSRHF